MSGDDKEYIWTIGDIRRLDDRLVDIENSQKTIEKELAKLTSSKPVVVDNANKGSNWTWQTIAIIIGSVMATIILTVEQILKADGK